MRDEFERRDEPQAVVVGPRTFIHGPYIKCPRCGKEQFGVVGIYGDRYSRRCKECLYPRGTEDSAVFPLPKLHKKIIYLDQCAISDMMKALNPKTKAHQKGSVRTEWRTAFEKLDTLCKLQLIVCPHSLFHAEESCVSKHYEALKDMYELLSSGVSFRSSDYIKSAQLHEYLLLWLAEEEQQCIEFDRSDALSGDADSWSQRIRVTLKPGFVSAFADDIRKSRERSWNEMKELFTEWQERDPKSTPQWYKSELGAFGRQLVEKHDSHIEYRYRMANRQVPVDCDALISPPLAYDQVQMVYRTCLRTAGSSDDARRLTSCYFSNADFSRLHYVRISVLLLAGLVRQAASGAKEPPNRGMKNDINMVSTIVPYCDAAFVDSKIHGLLKEGFIRERLGFDTRVFSPADFDALFAYLDDIKANATQEHLEKVREVYGDQWEKPFVEMFQLNKD